MKGMYIYTIIFSLALQGSLFSLFDGNIAAFAQTVTPINTQPTTAPEPTLTPIKSGLTTGIPTTTPTPITSGPTASPTSTVNPTIAGPTPTGIAPTPGVTIGVTPTISAPTPTDIEGNSPTPSQTTPTTTPKPNESKEDTKPKIEPTPVATGSAVLAVTPTRVPMVQSIKRVVRTGQIIQAPLNFVTNEVPRQFYKAAVSNRGSTLMVATATIFILTGIYLLSAPLLREFTQKSLYYPFKKGSRYGTS